jgi:sterol desaturase/sphingolipid hydroxylase (fatty acid hydroxylase superfamily)
MFAEWWKLRGRDKRVLGDMYDATPEELSGTQLPADELVPLGYEKRDTTASLTMLLGNVAVDLALAGVYGKIDSKLFKHRVSNFGQRRGSFVAAMVLWDFLYYWDHRWQHEVRLFWANHVAHHSGERYNLSTALRQPWFPFLMVWVFAPMSLLGFSTKSTLRAGQYNLLYQYWIHTEAIDRMHPTFEKYFNTPSHHRAHHGANKQYIDRNYAGILIVWDKLFGTFEPELRRVKYGLTKNIDTFNPIRIGYGEMADIVRDVKRAGSMRDRLGYVFGRPGWMPAHERALTQ